MTDAPAVARPRPHRLATALLAVALPLVVLAGTLGWVWSWRDELPDPVAVHWGPGGAPDGFSSVAGALAVPAVIAVLLVAAAAATGFVLDRYAALRRTAAGLATGTAALLSVLTAGSLHQQRGLADPAQSPDVGGTVALALGAALVVGALAAWVTPGETALPADGPVDPDAPRVALGPHERAAWARTAAGTAALAIGGGALVLVAGIAVTLQVPAALLVVLPVAALLAATAVFHVRVDATGLTVRSALGRPAWHVPLDEVEEARAVTVDPVREFGGWGYRIGVGGRAGVVLRRGDALEVRRSGGRVLVVTVDDAATGAALLNTLADRSRGATAG